MPRSQRYAPGGMVFHVLNRGVGRRNLFDKPGDFESFERVLIPELQRLQSQLQHRIQQASFDRGFHSPENQVELAKLIAHPCLPKPGVRQAAAQQATANVQFHQSRRQHSGIESTIGALQSGNGLARCRDHSHTGYLRYIGLGVLGRNILLLGKLLLAAEHPQCVAAMSLRGKAAA